MGHYFIAYSRRDFYFAESLFYALNSKRIDAWMDVWKITPGDEWADAIREAIQSSDGLLLVTSRDALRSPYVIKEIRQAHAARKPIYLVIRGRIRRKDLVIPAENPEDPSDSGIDIAKDAQVIVDMRGNFAKGIGTLATYMSGNAIHNDKIPGRFSFKMERILYFSVLIAILVLFMVITEVLAYGIEVFYTNQVPQFMADIRDLVHGNASEVVFIIPDALWTIFSFAALVNVVVFGITFCRRKHINDWQFYVLLGSAAFIAGTILVNDAFAAYLDYVSNVLNPISVYVKPGEHVPSVSHVPIILLVVHGVIALVIIILEIVFLVAFLTRKGRGAVLRWLPTGMASQTIRRTGNSEWIAKLPDDLVSRGPRYRSYCILASPEDGPAADEIRGMFRRKGYLITNNQDDAECLLVVLSPFSDVSPLQPPNSKDQSKPVIYVVTRSIRASSDLLIAKQWIDYRQPTADQFWKQWERRFVDLKRGLPVFPNVPETLGNPQLPTAYGRLIMVILCLLVGTSTLMISDLEYSVFVSRAIGGLLLLVSIVLLLAAACLACFTVTQMLRDNVTLLVARRWLAMAGILAIAAAFTTQSRQMIIGAFLAILLFSITMAVAWRSLRRWLPMKIRKTGHEPTDGSGQRLLRPISVYRAITSPTSVLLLAGFLVSTTALTNSDIVPNLPQPSAATSYTVAVPGPYYLGAPGTWSQDTNASAFGFHFTYDPDKLEITQDQANGYPTWLKFFSVSAAPMRFASHFRSSIHIHFTNSDIRTSVSLGLNNLFGDPLGPQLLLASSGQWRVIKSNFQYRDGQVNHSELSHDYTLEVEVNGTSCTYTINGKEVISFTDPSAAATKDIMLVVQSYVPGGMKLSFSDFTYMPVPSSDLGQINLYG